MLKAEPTRGTWHLVGRLLLFGVILVALAIANTLITFFLADLSLLLYSAVKNGGWSVYVINFDPHNPTVEILIRAHENPEVAMLEIYAVAAAMFLVNLLTLIAVLSLAYFLFWRRDT